MIKNYRWTLWLWLSLLLVACSSPRNLGSVSVRPTPQILTGFVALPTAVIPPTATPVIVTTTTFVTVTVTVNNPTPTLLPTWTPTVPPRSFQPNDPSNLPLGQNCDNANSQITYPRDGQAVILGMSLPITGTTNTANFAFYKVQYEPEVSYNDPAKRDLVWGELYRSEKNPKQIPSPKPVINGRLMDWETKTVSRGVYFLRLLSHDMYGNYPEPCVVKIVVQ